MTSFSQKSIADQLTQQKAALKNLEVKVSTSAGNITPGPNKGNMLQATSFISVRGEGTASVT